MDVETLVACLIGVVLVVGLVFVLRRMRQTRNVHAAESIIVARPPEQVDMEVQAALRDLPGTRVGVVGPGQLAIVVRRSPPWAVIPAMLAFPVGLVALLYRQDVALSLTLYREGEGTVVGLSGRTEVLVLDRVRSALLALPGAREQSPGVRV